CDVMSDVCSSYLIAVGDDVLTGDEGAGDQGDIAAGVDVSDADRAAGGFFTDAQAGSDVASIDVSARQQVDVCAGVEAIDADRSASREVDSIVVVDIIDVDQAGGIDDEGVGDVPISVGDEVAACRDDRVVGEGRAKADRSRIDRVGDEIAGVQDDAAGMQRPIVDVEGQQAVGRKAELASDIDRAVGDGEIGRAHVCTPV